MKRFLFIFPLILLSYFFYLLDDSPISSLAKIEKFENSDFVPNEKLSAEYFIRTKLQPKTKHLFATEKIIWRNKTDFPTNELQFHLYANAFLSNKTELAKRHYFDESEMTRININLLIVNGEKYQLTYFQPETDNINDSTVAKVILDEQINPGDSIFIQIDYDLKIPRSTKRFGYAAGREFYMIAQWFPKLGVYENGKWICSQYHPNTEFYSDFANYDVAIEVPVDYTVGATGQLVQAVETDSSKILNYSASNVIDFAWSASPEFEVVQRVYESTYNKDIIVKFLLQPENKSLIERNFNAAFNTIKFLEKYIGEFPYSNITLVDAPRTSNLGGMEYPGIVTFFTPLFTPIKLQNPESTIIHEIIHQYFYATVSSNEVYEGWVDEGITTYLERKILLRYYGRPNLHFKFIDYYPISGIRFLSFNEVPLIYTLRELKVDHFAFSLYAYYTNNDLGSLTDSTYMLPNYLSSVTNVYSKPSLIFHTLDNYIGSKEIFNLISDYYTENKFSTVTRDDLLNKIRNYKPIDLNWFVDNFVCSNKKFDYSVSSIWKTDETTYKIFVERLSEGITPTQLAIYTEGDTTLIEWNGVERWKEFRFVSDAPVIAAEVDPFRKNLLDRNFANNSYTMEPKYWASLSIAIRWLFWVQNALLIFGSVG